MASVLEIKRGQIDKLIKQTRKLYFRGISREERLLIGPFGNTYYSDDLVGLAILLTGIYDLSDEIKVSGKSSYITNEAVIYCANIDIILSYIRTTLKKKQAPFNIRPLYRPYRMSSYILSNKNAQILDSVEKLQKKKKSVNREVDMDEIAGYVGSIYSSIFSWKEDEYAKQLSEFGYYLGKYNYMMDCYKSLKSDEKKDRFNPLLYLKISSPEVFEAYCSSSLKSLADTCENCFEKFGLYKNADVLRNIIYSSVKLRYEEMINKKNRKKFFSNSQY